ncbi:glycosyltransferase family 4 protein [Alicyclobacillus ferrooxydans]|uniref:Glycosyl transferase family 1 domain-containing protein n=1 Tax=Alicyclobacillus ferrooxydans TaxID=471514 RepID=A0A0P9GRJ8_9BACL|nr:glycosyltransferase family 4 protein [Alicyclobacillus ferrooxydans]KPV43615.1 hypothetical protein AN477_11450 [Alicyclobacillus ferrooxydans]
MRIAIVAPEELPIPPVRGGSVQIYLHALIKKLAGRPGLQVTLLSPGTDRAKIKMNGLTHEVHSRRLRGMGYEAWVVRRIAELSPDVIQIENRPKLAHRILNLKSTGSGLRHAKVVLNLHSTTFVGPMNASRNTIVSTLKGVDAVVLNSRYLKRTVKTNFGLLPSAWNATVIYPGVERGRFSSINHSRTSGGEGSEGAGPGGAGSGGTGSADAGVTGAGPGVHKPMRLIFVGRVIQLKGVLVLVAAIRQLTRQGIPVRLTIVGRTPPWERGYGAKVRSAIKGLPIEWHGFVSPRRLPSLLKEHDVLVLPSQRREAFGLVNLEAMAAGLPVIASRVGGIPEVVTEKSGVLVDKYASAAAFAEAISRLSNNPRLYSTLCDGALQQSRAFTWTKTADAFESLYRKLSK